MVVAMVAAEPKAAPKAEPGLAVAYTAPVVASAPLVTSAVYERSFHGKASPFIASPYLASPYVASPYVASPYVASPYVAASPYAAAYTAPLLYR